MTVTTYPTASRPAICWMQPECGFFFTIGLHKQQKLYSDICCVSTGHLTACTTVVRIGTVPYRQDRDLPGTFSGLSVLLARHWATLLQAPVRAAAGDVSRVSHPHFRGRNLQLWSLSILS